MTIQKYFDSITKRYNLSIFAEKYRAEKLTD